MSGKCIRRRPRRYPVRVSLTLDALAALHRLADTFEMEPPALAALLVTLQLERLGELPMSSLSEEI